MTTQNISCTIPQKELKYLLDRARGAVGRMYPYFKIDIYLAGRLTCCATDLRVGVISETDNRNKDAVVECGGTICVSADKFYNLINALPENMITFRGLDSNRLEISCGTYNGVFPCVDPEAHFPDMIVPGGSPDVECLGGFLNDIYAAISHAVSTDEEKSIAGINLRAENGRLIGVATNGNRLSLAGISVPYDGECDPFNAGITLAPRSLGEIKKLLCGSCDVRFRDNRMSIEQTNITIISMLYDAAYPNYRRIIPTHPHSAVVSAAGLMEIVQRVGVLNESQAVTLHIRPGKILVSGESTAGCLIDSIDCEADESVPETDMLLTPAYLLESLKSLARDSEDVVLKWLDEKASLVMVPADHSNWDERLELIQPRSG